MGRVGTGLTPSDKAVEVCESEKTQETGGATDIRWHRDKDGTEFFANGFMNALSNEEAFSSVRKDPEKALPFFFTLPEKVAFAELSSANRGVFTNRAVFIRPDLIVESPKTQPQQLRGTRLVVVGMFQSQSNVGLFDFAHGDANWDL